MTNPAEPLKVLVVDDEESVRRLFMRVFARGGRYSITAAASAEEALQLLEKEAFAILVSDERMPGMRGSDLLDRAQKRWPDMVRIIMTGIVDRSNAKLAVDSGLVFAFIGKPFNQDELLSQLERAAEQIQGRMTGLADPSSTLSRLPKSGEYYRELLQEIRDCVFVATADGVLTDINQAGLELFGYTRQEIEAGKANLIDLYLNPQERAGILQKIISQGGVRDHPLKMKNRRGLPLEVLATANAIFDSNGQLIGSRGMIRDVTQSRRVERTMQELVDFQKTLLNALPVPVYFSDVDGHYLGMNREFEALFGLAIDDVIDKTVFDIYPPDQAAIHSQQDKELFRSPGMKVFESQIRDAAGTIHRVVFHKATFSDASGRVQGLIGAILDVSERIQREEDLRRKNDELKFTLGQLRTAQARLVQQEKLASIGSLAAGVAHELNNPIGFISSNFSTLKQYLTALSEFIALSQSLLQTEGLAENAHFSPLLKEIEADKQAKKIDYILRDIPELLAESQEGLERITSIVQNLRQFSRVDHESKYEPYDINLGLDNTLVVARNEIKYVAEVERAYGEIPPVECIAGEINQVFLNILVNAAQAIANQHRAEKGVIRVGTSVEGEVVRVEIGDDGPGIPEAIVGRIFDPFFTTKEAGKGTGLGLNISYDVVVNKHGGELTVQSEVGRGSRFVIKLPIRRAPATRGNGGAHG